MRGTVNNMVAEVEAPKAELKYSILSIIGGFSRERRSGLRRAISTELGINERTYDRWVNLPISSTVEIPYSKLQKIAARLGVSVDTLVNT